MKREFVLFLFVGALQYLLDVFLMYLLVKLSFSIAISNIVSRASAAFMGYFINGQYTFRSRNLLQKESLTKFIILWIGLTVVSTVAIYIGKFYTGGEFNPEIALIFKIIIEAILVLVSFLLQKFWVFK